LSSRTKDTAILLVHCEDKKGLVAAITDFLHKNNGNIIALDEHVDHDSNLFFMRVEWQLKDFTIPSEKMAEYFQTMIASKYDLKFKLKFSNEVPKVAIFVSKYSHCLFDIMSRYESGEWKIEIPLIISNHEKFRYIGERYNIPYHYFPITKDNKEEQEEAEYHLLKKHNIDLIVLARYMQVLSGSFCDRFRDRIINIHHSTLPAFAGANPYKAAYVRGVKLVGATAHYVTSDLDAGPIIRQGVIPVSHIDSVRDMKRKGRDIEKIVLADAVWSQLNHKIITCHNRTVVFA